jgi:hypothetical protein
MDPEDFSLTIGLIIPARWVSKKRENTRPEKKETRKINNQPQQIKL